MKAYQVSKEFSISSLELVDRSYPELLPNEVLVKMKANSLNYRDLMVVTGYSSWKPPVGRVPVSDGVGIIVEKGSAVTNLDVNDRIAGLFLPKWIDGKLTDEKLGGSLGGTKTDGLLQEYAVFDQNEVIKVPDFLSDEEAATLPCAGLTAWHGIIEKGDIKPGSTVLIQGTGGVSLFSAQFALMAGADVILLSSSDEKLALGKKMGINHLINYRQIPEWEKNIMDITSGRGVDHIVEVVGGSHINRSINVIALDGTISVIGLMGGLSAELNTVKIMSRQIRLQGIEVGSKEMFTHMNEALRTHQIHPVIDHIYPFEDAKSAFSHLEKGATGKIVIKY
ncbi:zinc-dependent alcohol dehydrogenase family protein [Chryseobacterium viscerum]|uniref:zinc-dependent alcohol dehydrogenase family protein n=1 Tax=Chryseobacterium viscerum TaxID=1037377 RepID=UPI0022216598|nr:NAD(P)-dependent alcohol dehydrogenase [Chryseobacterium viscerum]MCW1961001.1 NAD(P)-dependent alcohol dehydrogenase [Chryseobacterium viscerum]